ncbi:MAG TPA: hypothetical protein VFR38_06445 [Gaiellaceae bacterium]|nr:hypothetical protein [Gaiellaceae bacterium]
MVLLFLTFAIGTPGTAADRDTRTRVRLVDPAPLTLRGVDFVPLERVRLTVALEDRTTVRALRAGKRGRFTAVFPAIDFDRCHGSLAVRAVGSRGSRTSWELVPLDCPTRTNS